LPVGDPEQSQKQSQKGSQPHVRGNVDHVYLVDLLILNRPYRTPTSAKGHFEEEGRLRR